MKDFKSTVESEKLKIDIEKGNRAPKLSKLVSFVSSNKKILAAAAMSLAGSGIFFTETSKHAENSSIFEQVYIPENGKYGSFQKDGANILPELVDKYIARPKKGKVTGFLFNETEGMYEAVEVDSEDMMPVEPFEPEKYNGGPVDKKTLVAAERLAVRQGRGSAVLGFMSLAFGTLLCARIREEEYNQTKL